MTRTKALAATVIIAAGVTVAPQLAGATCGHPGQPDWCPALPTTTTTTAPTTTSTVPTTTTTVVAPTTTEAVMGDVVVDIGTPLSISRGAIPVKVNVPKLAG